MMIMSGQDDQDDKDDGPDDGDTHQICFIDN